MSCHTTEERCSCDRCTAQRVERAQQQKELMATPLYRLPAELLINIVDRVDLVNFPALMIAIFHLLRKRGIVPTYPTDMLQLVLLRQGDGDANATSLATMPKELLLAIGQTLTTNEKIHMVLATYRMRPEEIEMITHKH